MSTTRQIPSIPEIEASVLGTMLLYEDAMLNYGDMLSVELFYEVKHVTICEVILSLHKQGQNVDILSVSNELKKTKKTHFASFSDVSDLTNKGLLSLVNIERDIFILKEYAMRRKCMSEAQKILAKCGDVTVDVFDLLSEVSNSTEKQLDEFCKQPETSAAELLGKTVMQIFKDFKEMNDFRSGKTDKSVFVSSGFTDLDNLIGYFRKSCLYIIGARPAMGKSALVTTIAVNAAKQGKKGLIFSLEMSSREIMTRIISQETEIQSSRISALKIDSIDLEKIMLPEVCNRISKFPLYFDDTSNIVLSHVRARCKKLKKQGKLDFVVIDYLQLMKSDANKNANANDRIGELSKGLKNIAKDLDVPVIVLSQLNRQVESRNGGRPVGKPSLSDLRDSGAIEQDADVVMLLWRPDYYKDPKEVEHTVRGSVNPQGRAFVEVAKQRSGETGIVPLEFIGRLTKFENYKQDEPATITYDPNSRIEPNNSFEDIPF